MLWQIGTGASESFNRGDQFGRVFPLFMHADNNGLIETSQQALLLQLWQYDYI